MPCGSVTLTSIVDRGDWLDRMNGRLVANFNDGSFAGYTETSLTVSCFVYALASSFVLAVFLLKYRIEYLLIAPVVIALFAHYLALSMQPGSSAQKPEKLIRERGLMALVALLTALFVLLTFVNVPALEPLAGQKYISIQ